VLTTVATDNTYMHKYCATAQKIGRLMYLDPWFKKRWCQLICCSWQVLSILV